MPAAGFLLRDLAQLIPVFSFYRDDSREGEKFDYNRIRLTATLFDYSNSFPGAIY